MKEYDEALLKRLRHKLEDLIRKDTNALIAALKAVKLLREE